MGQGWEGQGCGEEQRGTGCQAGGAGLRRAQAWRGERNKWLPRGPGRVAGGLSLRGGTQAQELSGAGAGALGRPGGCSAGKIRVSAYLWEPAGQRVGREKRQGRTVTRSPWSVRGWGKHRQQGHGSPQKYPLGGSVSNVHLTYTYRGSLVTAASKGPE